MKKQIIVVLVLVFIAGLSVMMAGKKEMETEYPPQETLAELEGYVVMGHEVRTFRPCGDAEKEHFIIGSSKAYSELQRLYDESMGDTPKVNYAPVFAVVRGSTTTAAQDGFGADFEISIDIDEVIEMDRKLSCKSDLIVLNSPLAGSTIENPLNIEGEARGVWFFEGDFPVMLTDWDGKIIAEGFVSAEGEWMTEEFVPFKGSLDFVAPEYGERGTLILQKDNPSDIRELDDALEIPIIF